MNMRMTWMVMKIALLPFAVLSALVWAQAHSVHMDMNKPPSVTAPTCKHGNPSVGELPGAVLIETQTGWREVRNTKIIGSALDQVFGDGPKEHIVVDFCK